MTGKGPPEKTFVQKHGIGHTHSGSILYAVEPLPGIGLIQTMKLVSPQLWAEPSVSMRQAVSTGFQLSPVSPFALSGVSGDILIFLSSVLTKPCVTFTPVRWVAT